MKVLTLGECLAEFYGKEIDKPLFTPANYFGPIPTGAPVIFAVTLAKLDQEPGFIGSVGDDDFGKTFDRIFEENGISTSKLKKCEDFKTGTSFVTYFSDGSRKFFFHLGNTAAGQLSPNDITKEYVEEFDFLHITGSTLYINEKTRQSVYKAAKLAKEEELTVTFDPNVRLELMKKERIKNVTEPVLENCDYLLPDEKELKIISEKESVRKSIKKLQQYDLNAIIIKKGEKGATVYNGEKFIEISPISVEERDPTGAGDSFDAGFVYSLINNKNLEEAAKFANAVGAKSVTSKMSIPEIENVEEIKRLMENSKN